MGSSSSKERLFGTDGVRGIPGRYPLLPENVRSIAAIAARLLLERDAAKFNGGGPFVLLGRDTRGSGPELAKQLVAGFADAGCRTIDLGVIPTPGLSYLTPKLGALCGVVISASHNPAEFNGIKFFDAAGYKMATGMEDRIERELESVRGTAKRSQAAAVDGSAHVDSYLDFLRSTFPATADLSGLKLVVDCAHGASSGLAKRLFEGLGAQVTALSCQPNGKNINLACGALFPGAMQKAVVQKKADAGVCFDGDADRAIFSDEKGALLDGDSLICFSALRLRRLGLLRNDKVVLTVMSNFGLVRALEKQGISVVSVPVGDRNVSDAIEREDLSIGGAASGHVIFRRYAATGDGMLTALQTLAALRESGGKLSEIRRAFSPIPQVLENLEVRERVPLDGLPGLKQLIDKLEKELRGEGRIFLRYSGTEPLLRVMIEGPSLSRVKAMAKEISEAYRRESGQTA